MPGMALQVTKIQQIFGKTMPDFRTKAPDPLQWYNRPTAMGRLSHWSRTTVSLQWDGWKVSTNMPSKRCLRTGQAVHRRWRSYLKTF